MTGILKVTDADLIDADDTDSLLLCLIPSGKIKLKKSEYDFLKELFNENIEVIDIEPEPEPPDPDEYIARSDIPEYLWKFIKYAMTRPANISADSYLHMCQLLQALPQRLSNNAIFNWTDQNYYALQFGYNNSISITADGYYFKNGQTIQTKNYINPRQHNFKFSGRFKFTGTNNTIFHLADVSNTTNPNKFMVLKTFAAGFNFQARAYGASSLPASNFNLTFNHTVNWNEPIEIGFYGGYNDCSEAYEVFYDVIYIDTNNQQHQEQEQGKIPLNRITNSVLVERLNAWIYRSSGATVNTTISGNKYFQEYNLTNETTGNTTIIKFDKSKIIDDKLLIIV